MYRSNVGNLIVRLRHVGTFQRNRGRRGASFQVNPTSSLERLLFRGYRGVIPFALVWYCAFLRIFVRPTTTRRFHHRVLIRGEEARIRELLTSVSFIGRLQVNCHPARTRAQYRSFQRKTRVCSAIEDGQVCHECVFPFVSGFPMETILSGRRVVFANRFRRRLPLLRDGELTKEILRVQGRMRRLSNLSL